MSVPTGISGATTSAPSYTRRDLANEQPNSSETAAETKATATPNIQSHLDDLSSFEFKTLAEAQITPETKGFKDIPVKTTEAATQTVDDDTKASPEVKGFKDTPTPISSSEIPDDTKASPEVKGAKERIEAVVNTVKENINLVKDETHKVVEFVKDLEKPVINTEKNSAQVALFGISQAEYDAVKNSKKILLEEGEAENGKKYAIFNGVSVDLLKDLNKDMKSGMFNLNNPRKDDYENKVREYEGKANKSTDDYEKLLAYKYVTQNWEQFNKAGGANKLSQSNIAQLEKQGGKDGFVTNGDINVSETLKNNYHRKNVWSTVATAVVGTAATILTGGALGPVVAGAIGAAAGSVAGGIIQEKKFGEIVKDAAIAAAMGAVGGVAAKGVGAATSKLTTKIGSEVAKKAINAAATGAARGATTATLGDLADDGKLNNLNNIAKQTLIGAASGAAASGVSSSMGNFGSTFVGKSLERGLQQGTQYAINDLTDGNGKFDWGNLGAEVAGGIVTGAVEQGVEAIGNKLIPNPVGRPLVDGVVSGVGGFIAGAAGELAEGAINGNIDEMEVLTSASANMQTNAVEAFNKSYQEKQELLKKTNVNLSVDGYDANLKQALANNDRIAMKYLLENRGTIINPNDPNYDRINALYGNINSIQDYKEHKPVFIKPKEVKLPESNHELIKHEHKPLKPLPETQDEKVRAEKIAAYEAAEKQKLLDAMPFDAAFATAMKDATNPETCDYATDSKGNPIFTWKEKQYALKYAPQVSTSSAPTTLAATGNNSTVSMGHGSGNKPKSTSQLSQQMSNKAKTYTGEQTATPNTDAAAGIVGMVLDVTKSTLNFFAKEGELINTTRRVLKGVKVVGDSFKVANGIQDIRNGDNFAGVMNITSGTLGLASNLKYVKGAGWVTFAASAASAASRQAKGDEFGAVIDYISGAVGAVPTPLTVGISYGLEAFQFGRDMYLAYREAHKAAKAKTSASAKPKTTTKTTTTRKAA